MTTSQRTNERVNGMPLSMATLGNNAAPAWRPNWIDYRASVANVDRREDRGETVETCRECGCETDVTPAPHSPKCPTLNGGAVDGRDLLDRMDAGEPLSDDEDGLEEAAAVGERAASGAPPLVGEPERAAASSSPKRKWTRETVIEAIREVAENVGHTPSGKEMAAAGFGGACFAASKSGHLAPGVGCWKELVREAGFEPNTTGTGGQRRGTKGSGREPQSEEADGHGAVPAESVSPPAVAEAEAASRPDDPEPEDPAAVDVTEVQLLLEVIDLLDVDPAEDDALLAVVQSPGGGGWDYTEARTLFRRLVREELNRWSLEDIGDAVLATIDERAAA